MATEYKGFNIPEKVIIVKREISAWKDGKRVPSGEYQGYVVPSDSEKMLETALNWAGCKYEYRDGKFEYIDKDKYMKEYTNGNFELKITNAAADSSQSGKLSFWDCTITAEDGCSYLIGINSDLLCSLLVNATFVNGVCQPKIWLGRQKSRVGAFTNTMDEFLQAQKDAELRSRKMSTKYEPGQRVFTKTSQSVYLGEMYKLVDIIEPVHRRWPDCKPQIVIYDEPKKVHVYGNYKYEFSRDLRHWTHVYDFTQISDVTIESKKTNQYFNEGETFEISQTYEEYCKIKDAVLKNKLDETDNAIKECCTNQELTRLERKKQQVIHDIAFQKACYTDNPNIVLSKEELDKLLVIIKDYIAHDYDYYYGEPSYDKINNYDISIGAKHGKQ